MLYENLIKLAIINHAALFPCCVKGIKTFFFKFQVDLPVIPTLLDTQCIGARLDPKFCPVAPDYVAFINSGDIWVTYVNTFNEMQLTHTQTGELPILTKLEC